MQVFKKTKPLKVIKRETKFFTKGTWFKNIAKLFDTRGEKFIWNLIHKFVY